jgi:hypothetical protein
MHRCRVDWHELAVEGWIGATDRPVAIAPQEAAEVAKAYLIDAAMSLAEGRGPLVV